jgi:hypothetical protein
MHDDVCLCGEARCYITLYWKGKSYKIKKRYPLVAISLYYTICYLLYAVYLLGLGDNGTDSIVGSIRDVLNISFNDIGSRICDVEN